MNKRVLLVDVDGTVLEREKLRALQEIKCRELLGDVANSIWEAYENHKTRNKGQVKVDEFIGEMGGGEQIRAVFYGVDFGACVDRVGWEALEKLAVNMGIDLILFSQGETEGYQKHKIQQMGLGGLPMEIHPNKIEVLSKIVEKLRSQGYTDIGYIDNEGDKLASARERFPEIRTFLAQAEGDTSGLGVAVDEALKSYKPRIIGKEGGSL